MDGDTCVAGYIEGKYTKLLFDIEAVFEFVVHYLVHMICFFYFYGKVIRTSNKVMKKQEDTTSANTQKVKCLMFFFRLTNLTQIYFHDIPL